MNIYYIVCRVDNGSTVCGQVSIVLAHSLDEAAKATVDYWNNQYDTVAKFVRGHEIPQDTSPKIIISQECQR